MQKVLVVDNHPVIRRLLGAWLEKQDYQVRAAEDGLRALEVLADFAPDLALIDLVMPNIDGARLCRVIRSRPHLAETVLVVISSVVAEQEFDPAACGADACIAKGSFDKISGHLLTIFKDLAEHGRIQPAHRQLGVEDVFRREISRELLSLQHHHELVLDNINDGIVELDQRGRITFANPAALAMLAGREEELLGREVYPLLPPEPAADLRRLLAVAPPRSANLAKPLCLVDKQVLLAVYPVEDEEGYSFILLLRDISETRAAEMELRQTSDELRRSLAELKSAQAVLVRQEKLASIGTLAAGVAHEILNPLNTIGVIVQLARQEEGLPADLADQLDEIMTQIGRATKIANSLRMFSHPGKGEKEPVNLHALLDDTLELAGHDLQLDNIAVERNYTPRAPVVMADPDQLAQVLLNLVNNARDAMRASPERRLTLTTGRVEQGATITVADSGSGIAAADLPKIFDPFFTTKDPGRGTGMGLAIVYSIVDSLGGVVEVRSEPGRGTEFFILLPEPAAVDGSSGTTVEGGRDE